MADDPLAEAYFLSYTDYLTPDSLYLAHTGSDKRELLKSRPHFFDSTGMRVEQKFATSKDGTKVPYFIIWPKGAKADGQNPTLLYGYGGFEISLTPSYSGGIGKAWHEHGGVWVYANIRGGGEYGPAWHQAAVKENKQRSYDDFVAVAEDLIATQGDQPAPPRHRGRQQRRPAGGRGHDAAPRPVQRRQLPGAAAGHAALQQAAGRRVVDGRVRQPRHPRRVGLDLEVQPLPERAQGHARTRRSSSPRPRATTACTRATRARWPRA